MTVSPKVIVCTAVFCAGVCGLVGMRFVWGCLAPRINGPDTAELRDCGNRVIAAIEKFRETHGRYPKSLVELGEEVPSTRYGPWEYETDETGFVSQVGDYFRDGFIYYYSSRARVWYADT